MPKMGDSQGGNRGANQELTGPPREVVACAEYSRFLGNSESLPVAMGFFGQLPLDLLAAEPDRRSTPDRSPVYPFVAQEYPACELFALLRTAK